MEKRTRRNLDDPTPGTSNASSPDRHLSMPGLSSRNNSLVSLPGISVNAPPETQMGLNMYEELQAKIQQLSEQLVTMQV